MELIRRLNCCTIVSIVCIFAFLISEYSVANACEVDQTHHGCRIDNGACSCAYGCKSDYRYATRRECMDALKGRASDVCGRRPCTNGGTCIQITQTPGYRCRCEGTGYWGSRCQRLCPTAADSHMLAQYPYECIII